MILFDTEIANGLRRHAERAYPMECCGALLGKHDGKKKSVVRIEPTKNRRDGEVARRRFVLTTEDYRALEKKAKAGGMEVLGFYHSHPDHPAQPSEYDRVHASPCFSYVILSVVAGESTEMASWVLANDHSVFERESLIQNGKAWKTTLF